MKLRPQRAPGLPVLCLPFSEPNIVVVVQHSSFPFSPQTLIDVFLLRILCLAPDCPIIVLWR